MQSDKSLTRQAGRVLLVVTALGLSLLFVVAAGESAAAAEVEPGQLWVLPQYRVPGCEPMPRVPTVFNWLVRKALAVEAFMATSVDCGQVRRRGAVEGWTYVFWSESEETAVARLLRRAQEKYGLTELVMRGMGEAHLVRAKGYEPFFLMQLGGEQGPVRFWSAGDVASLEGAISVAGDNVFEVRLESITHEGNRCEATRTVRPGASGGAREALSCR